MEILLEQVRFLLKRHSYSCDVLATWPSSDRNRRLFKWTNYCCTLKDDQQAAGVRGAQAAGPRRDDATSNPGPSGVAVAAAGGHVPKKSGSTGSTGTTSGPLESTLLDMSGKYRCRWDCSASMRGLFYSFPLIAQKSTRTPVHISVVLDVLGKTRKV
jgi:hypothetical protein